MAQIPKNPTTEHWAKRMGEINSHSLQLSAEVAKELADQYEYMGSEISKEIQALLAKYPTRQELLQRSDRTDLNRLRIIMKMNGFDVNDPQVKKDMAKLNRLETTLQHIGMIVKQNYDSNTSILTDHFTEVYGHTVSQLSKDFERIGLNTNPNMLVLSKDQLEYVLTNKWSGKNYSQIWAGQEKELEVALKATLKQGFLNGYSMDKMTKLVKQRLSASYSNAMRLIRTETIYVSNQGALNSFKNSGVVEYFKFDAHLDNRTSDICTEMEMKDKVYRMDEAEIGVNVPPLHPNCRSTIVPYIPRFEKDGHLYPTTHDDYLKKEKEAEEERKRKEAERSARKYGNTEFTTKNQVISHLKKHCGFEKVSLSGLDLDMASVIGNVLGAVFDQFPQMKGKVAEFKPTDSDGAYASITTYSNRVTGKISKMVFSFNGKMCPNTKTAERLYLRDLASGFHPANTSYKDILVHECGHVLDNVTGGEKYGQDLVNNLFEQAQKNLGYTNAQMTNQVMHVSKYATQSKKELWAEAFADVYCNGSKAHPLSQELVKLWKEQYLSKME